MLHMPTYVLENSVTSHIAVKHRHTFTTVCLEVKEFIACMVFKGVSESMIRVNQSD